jgi:hypothetical protein
MMAFVLLNKRIIMQMQLNQSKVHEEMERKQKGRQKMGCLSIKL